MRKVRFLGALTVVMCLFMSLGSTQALATYADAWSFIKWNSISFDYTGTGSITNDSIQTNAYAINANGDELTDSSNIESVAEFDSDTFWGWGLSDAEDLYAEAFVEGQNGMAYGDAGYYGTYTAESAGTLTVSFSAELAYDLVSDADENAWADVWYEFTLGDLTATDALESEAFGGMEFSKGIPDMISLSIDLAEGESIDFSMMTAAQAQVSAVPIPGAVWLLASGLAGVIGIRGRRS